MANTNNQIAEWMNENLRDIVYDAVSQMIDIDSVTDAVVSEIESSDIVNVGNPEDALVGELLRRIMHATEDCSYFETATRMLELRKFAKDTIANR